VIQFDGVLRVSPATEVGAVMAQMMPIMFSALANGQDPSTLDQSALVPALMGSGTGATDFAHVLELDEPIDGRTFVVIVKPDRLFGSAAIDDLEGDVSVFGLVDRLIPQGGSQSLERYLLPGLNRVARRAMSANSMNDLLQNFSQLGGRSVSSDAVNLSGPAAVVTPLAIY